MTYELRELFQMHLGTRRHPKFELFDLNGTTDFVISAATWEFRNATTKALVDNGSCTINNADTDVAGNTVKTVWLDLNLTNTDIELGQYNLIIHITLTNGEDDKFKVPVEVLDYEEV